MRIRSALKGAAALFAMSVAMTGVSYAITFDLTSDHCTGGCGTAPFGTVELTQLGANVQVIVDLANGPPNAVGWAKTGSADFQEFKFNATGVVLGDITVTQTFAGQTLAPQTGTFNGDGTGDFTFGIACTTCGNGNLGITSNIQFLVANALIAELTAANANGNIFVADVFSGQTGNTGPVDVSGTPSQVPLPPAALLFGTALVGMTVLGRRRRNRDVNATA
jgi:hypothetical protein